jgi:hypothetical protein
MNEGKFKTFMVAVESIGGEYAEAYKRGLRRHYHGESEHKAWLELNGSRQELGDGYRDGFSGKAPRGFHGNIGNANAQGELPADSMIKFRINSQLKSAFVKQAQRENMTLTEWIIRNCNERIQF